MCIICDEDDYHNDDSNYDENGVFVSPERRRERAQRE